MDPNRCCVLGANLRAVQGAQPLTTVPAGYCDQRSEGTLCLCSGWLAKPATRIRTFDIATTYRGEAQNDSPTASGLAQSKAQLVVGDIVVHLFVTYQSGALLGVPQLREAVTLAGDVGRRLASAK